jgi:hypothetical protein
MRRRFLDAAEKRIVVASLAVVETLVELSFKSLMDGIRDRDMVIMPSIYLPRLLTNRF